MVSYCYNQVGKEMYSVWLWLPLLAPERRFDYPIQLSPSPSCLRKLTVHLEPSTSTQGRILQGLQKQVSTFNLHRKTPLRRKRMID